MFSVSAVIGVFSMFMVSGLMFGVSRVIDGFSVSGRIGGLSICRLLGMFDVLDMCSMNSVCVTCVTVCSVVFIVIGCLVPL